MTGRGGEQGSAVDRPLPLPLALFDPRSIAMIGASPRAGSFAGRALVELQRHGFAGDVTAVNPNYDEVHGVRSVPDLASVPGAPDLVLVFVPAERVPDAIREAGEAGATAAIVFASGFGEIGDRGVALDAELRTAIDESGVRVLGPNCQGMVNFDTGVVATFTGAVTAEDLPPASRLAYVGQSGAVGGSFFDLARARGVVPAVWVSTGNEIDIGTVEVVERLVDAATVDTVCVYLEQLPPYTPWIRALRTARLNGVRVLVMRSGRADAGRRAAAGHTGSLVGEGRAFEVATEMAGGLLVDDLEDLINVAIAANAGFGGGARTGIVTSSGGAGGVTADLCELNGLEVPSLGAETTDRLSAFVPDFGAVGNPVDVTAQLFSRNIDDFATVCEITANDPRLDHLLVVLSMVAEPMASRVAGSLVQACSSVKAPLGVVYLASHERTAPARAMLAAHGVPVFDSMRGAVTAIARLAHASAMPSIGGADPSDGERDVPPTSAAEVLHGLVASYADGGSLTEWEAAPLLDAASVSRPDTELATSSDEAVAAAARLQREGPSGVVMKVQAPSLTHKTEHDAVRVGVDASDVASTYDQLVRNAVDAGFDDVEGVLVQTIAAAGVELLVGITASDDGYPPLITVGIGGTAVELYADVASAVAPVTVVEAGRLLRSLRGFPLLDGHRGRTPADIDAAAAAVANLSRVAVDAGPRLMELEVNPLLVHDRGAGATAVDLLLTLRADVSSTSDPAVSSPRAAG